MSRYFPSSAGGPHYSPLEARALASVLRVSRGPSISTNSIPILRSLCMQTCCAEYTQSRELASQVCSHVGSALVLDVDLRSANCPFFHQYIFVWTCCSVCGHPSTRRSLPRCLKRLYPVRVSMLCLSDPCRLATWPTSVHKRHCSRWCGAVCVCKRSWCLVGRGNSVLVLPPRLPVCLPSSPVQIKVADLSKARGQ